jgi:hypothetical protein
MAKVIASETGKVVRDAKSGRLIAVRGFGALQDRLEVKKGFDLTKPIASHAAKAESTTVAKH